MRIKKGDQVLIIAGKDRLRKARVIKVLPSHGRLVVEGINIVKRHQRPKQQGAKGQVVEIPMSLDVSNVKLICPQCSRPTRVGVKIIEDGRKARICKKCQKEI